MTTAFLEVFGENPINKVIDFLIVNDDFDYSMTDISKLAGVAYSTLKTFWVRLEKGGIIVNTRGVGNAKLYRLNDYHPAVQKLKEFYWAVTKKQVLPELNTAIAA